MRRLESAVSKVIPRTSLHRFLSRCPEGSGVWEQLWDQVRVLFDRVVVIAGNQYLVAMRLRFKPFSKRFQGR